MFVSICKKNVAIEKMFWSNKFFTSSDQVVSFCYFCVYEEKFQKVFFLKKNTWLARKFCYKLLHWNRSSKDSEKKKNRKVFVCLVSYIILFSYISKIKENLKIVTKPITRIENCASVAMVKRQNGSDHKKSFGRMLFRNVIWLFYLNGFFTFKKGIRIKVEIISFFFVL